MSTKPETSELTLRDVAAMEVRYRDDMNEDDARDLFAAARRGVKRRSSLSAIGAPTREDAEGFVRLIVESFRDAPNPSVEIAVEEIMMTFLDAPIMDERRVVGAVPGPREGWVTVVCDDGSVFVGLDCGDDWPLHVERGAWHKATPIPGTPAAIAAAKLAEIDPEAF